VVVGATLAEPLKGRVPVPTLGVMEMAVALVLVQVRVTACPELMVAAEDCSVTCGALAAGAAAWVPEQPERSTAKKLRTKAAREQKRCVRSIRKTQSLEAATLVGVVDGYGWLNQKILLVLILYCEFARPGGRGECEEVA
jgi:hypothetical protein